MNSALVQNTILSLVTTSLTFAVVFLLNHLHKKKSITNEVLRKVIHIGAGTFYLAIYFYDDHGQFSKYLNIFPNLLWMCILIWKSQHHSSTHQPHDPILDIMTRNKHQSELLYGPLFFNSVVVICGTIFYKTIPGSLIMSLLTWGDGLAAVIGVRYGSQRKIYGKKSLDGLLTFFIVGIIASIIYIAVLVNLQSVHLVKICVISFITAVVETLTSSDVDNLTVPLSILVSYYFIF
ncbi:unnamed protein product [Adineta steineri]|uniref:Dolichol kinase n=1 Tax=Adineta steineri TaxID=433720 RepID=A0A815CTU3_9BILA|nr:unnamed protein product [Adineta steineri]CAF1204526.1 unnamed protein product [Adineta steineri]CAF1288517.1 unnamed protein product [Adineta steineri]